MTEKSVESSEPKVQIPGDRSKNSKAEHGSVSSLTEKVLTALGNGKSGSMSSIVESVVSSLSKDDVKAIKDIIPEGLHQDVEKMRQEKMREDTEKKEGPCGKCGKSAINKCGRCKQVFYCSKECQKDDWKEGHKEKCQNPIQKILESDKIPEPTSEVLSGKKKWRKGRKGKDEDTPPGIPADFKITDEMLGKVQSFIGSREQPNASKKLESKRRIARDSSLGKKVPEGMGLDIFGSMGKKKQKQILNHPMLKDEKKRKEIIDKINMGDIPDSVKRFIGDISKGKKA